MSYFLKNTSTGTSTKTLKRTSRIYYTDAKYTAPLPNPSSPHTRCWDCIHPKFSMFSSHSFHQLDAQVDSSLYNYLSYKENCADLKQQPPWHYWPKCYIGWSSASCPKTCYWFRQSCRTINHHLGLDEGPWSAHVHFIRIFLRSEDFSPLCF